MIAALLVAVGIGEAIPLILGTGSYSTSRQQSSSREDRRIAPSNSTFTTSRGFSDAWIFPYRTERFWLSQSRPLIWT